jgi:hypothetical protein
MAEGRMIWDSHETWYSVLGELDSGPTPVIVCHGGPGAAHDYTEPIAELSRFGRGTVLYDRPIFERVTFEQLAPLIRSTWVVACRSLHHVPDLDFALG